jgi:hypothetical protein
MFLEGERREGTYRAPRGDRDNYRRRDDDGGKKEGAGGDFRPEFVSKHLYYMIYTCIY